MKPGDIKIDFKLNPELFAALKKMQPGALQEGLQAATKKILQAFSQPASIVGLPPQPMGDDFVDRAEAYLASEYSLRDLADMAFERSIANLAEYHRLGDWRFIPRDHVKRVARVQQLLGWHGLGLLRQWQNASRRGRQADPARKRTPRAARRRKARRNRDR